VLKKQISIELSSGRKLSHPKKETGGFEMRKLSLVLAVFVLIAATVQADTIHLKNGSILKGKVTSFADEQFTVMIDTGSGRYLSRATVYVGDVSRVEFDAAAGGVADVNSTGESAPPTREPATQPDETKASGAKETRNTDAGEQPAAKPVETEQPASKADTEAPKEEPKPKEPDASSQPPVSSLPVSEPEPDKTSRKSAPIRTVSVDVVGKRDWTSSGLIVKRGDRLRISASGTVTLDPISGKTSGPEGVADLPDPKKLMPDQATGALIGVIGADNDDFIFIGKAAEFTAARDGLLFLSVNEGTLSDNSGTYKATIELQASRRSQ
jgi:hypothetical protein